MKVALLTPFKKQEGLSEYSRMFTEELKKFIDVEIFDLSKLSLRSRLQYLTFDKFDLVHIQHELAHWGSFTNPLRTPRFFEFCQKVKVPKVVTFHSVDLKGETWKKWGWWGRHRFLKMHNLPQGSIVHTGYAKEGLIKMGVPASKIHVIPIGVPDLESWKDRGLESKKRKLENWKIRELESKRLIAIFGFINPDKGYEIVLNTLPDLPQDVIFIIAGGVQDQSNQAYLNTLNSLITQMGLQNRVFITGFLEKQKMFSLMQQTKIILFPRTHVNASLELSLAIAFQKPILASNLPYFVEVNSRVPCLEIFEFEGGRVENFKKKLLRLLGDKLRQQELSEKCSEYAQKYSWEEIAKITIGIYSSVLQP